MLTAQSKVTPHPDVIYTSLQEGSGILLNLLTRQYFTLNESGNRIWLLLSEGLTLGEISQALESQYDVTAEQAEQSVVDLVGELATEQLVLITHEQVRAELES